MMCMIIALLVKLLSCGGGIQWDILCILKEYSQGEYNVAYRESHR